MSAPSLSVETIKIYAEASNIVNLKDDAASALIPEVDYRLRELVQDAAKFMRHAKRKRLTTTDINNALRLKNTETLYGFSNPEPLKFIRPTSDQDLYVIEDKELEIEDVLSAPLPKCPTECSFTMHWLAVKGIQPVIPQNPLPPPDESQTRLLNQEIINQATPDANIQIRQLTRHKISQELLQYLEKIKEGLLDPIVRVNVSTTNGSYTDQSLMSAITSPQSAISSVILPSVTRGSKGELADGSQDKEPRSSFVTIGFNPIQRRILKSLAIDPGLQQLVPYISQFITEEVRNNIRNLPVLKSLMEATFGILSNTHMNVEPYLHQLMPSIITCIVGGRLSKDPLEDHWGLRDFAVHIISHICKRYSHTYQTLQPRLIKTLLNGMLDEGKPLSTLYGAIVGLASISDNVVQILILPNIQNTISRLEKHLSSADPVKRMEARRCHGILLRICGRYFHTQSMQSRTSALLAITRPLPSAIATAKTSTDTTMKSDTTNASEAKDTNTIATNAPTIHSQTLQGSIHGGYSDMYEVFGESLIPYSMSGAFGAPLPEADMLL
eukprot:TRINITY_DN8676_c0_g1_i1.p1 TRINITY_DN8676_c0_g1~~TRINITY_DN8676_c0_g1_i1.p1  ORF type:complete len:554 (+),score=108.25 TRINITY_DN8676_c0_g1_i1:144-1805(+)